MLILNFCPSILRLPAVAASAVHRWNNVSDTASQDTITVFSIPRPIWLTGRFFVGWYSEVDRDGSTKAVINVTPSGTLSTFYHPLCLILSSRVYSTIVLIVSLLFCRPHFPPSSSSVMSFVVTIVPTLYIISSDAILITLWPCHPHQSAYIIPFAAPCNNKSPTQLHPSPPYTPSRHLWRPPPPSCPQLRMFCSAKAGLCRLPPHSFPPYHRSNGKYKYHQLLPLPTTSLMLIPLGGTIYLSTPPLGRLISEGCCCLSLYSCVLILSSP